MTVTTVSQHSRASRSTIGGAYLDLPWPVLILCLGSLINRAGSFVLLFLTIYVSDELDLGVTFATTCIGVYGLGSIAASLVGGQLADRFGRRPVMVFALLGGATVLVALSGTQDRWQFLALVFLLALVLDTFRPAASAMVGDLVGPAQRPHAFALMYISFNLGFALAAPIGGLLASYSFKWLFWGDALTTASYALIVIFCLKETLPSAKHKHGEARKGANGVVPWRVAAAHILKDQPFMLFSIATFLTSVVFMQAFSTLPISMKQDGFSEKQLGLLLAANGILIVITQLPVTHWLTRYNRMAMILVGEALVAIGFGLTAFAGTWQFYLFTIMVWTLGEVVQASFKQSFVADHAPAEMRARYMGVFALCHAAGMMVGAPIGGEVLSRFGASVLWFACFVVASAALVLYTIVLIGAAKPRLNIDQVDGDA